MPGRKRALQTLWQLLEHRAHSRPLIAKAAQRVPAFDCQVLIQPGHRCANLGQRRVHLGRWDVNAFAVNL